VTEENFKTSVVALVIGRGHTAILPQKVLKCMMPPYLAISAIITPIFMPHPIAARGGQPLVPPLLCQ